MAENSKTQILVVDDNKDNADIIRDYLESRGHPITVAYSGDDAMTEFERVHPRLVLLDVMMPGKDGWEVCRDMKSHPTLGKSVRIIMVTALDDWMNKRQAIQTGADDFVEKPFELAKLGAAVDRNLAKLSPPA
jgi:two-component system response regulator VicR